MRRIRVHTQLVDKPRESHPNSIPTGDYQVDDDMPQLLVRLEVVRVVVSHREVRKFGNEITRKQGLQA